jgi:hypothetical protein
MHHRCLRARRRTASIALAILAGSTVCAPSIAAAATGAQVRQATGRAADDIRVAVEQFRTDLGGGSAAGANGSFGGVRREINWDAVPDQFAAPSDLPNDFFNTRSPRGAVFSTPGASVLVSSRASSGVPVRFGDINASYSGEFGAFSPERIFGSAGSTVTDVSFFVPGTQTKALVKSFGVVFTDVDSPDSSSLELIAADGTSLQTIRVPATAGIATFSFVGASFPDAVIAKVRITSGGALLSGGVNDGPLASRDKVAMDDFLYSEPVPAPADSPTTTISPASPATAAPVTSARVTSAPRTVASIPAKKVATTKKRR